jgi:hypothetical protein
MLVAQLANREQNPVPIRFTHSNHSDHGHTTFGGKKETNIRVASRSRTTTKQKPNLETQTDANNGKTSLSIVHQNNRAGWGTQITPNLEGIINNKKIKNSAEEQQLERERRHS